ncbi:MAG: NfeD family protein [Rhizobiales bacterium]|nr:NfeD family protein [Hyphomicrobiales bacterium]
MFNTFAMLGVWTWFILGVLLMVLEIVAPGAFMIWFGLSAILVGLISLAVDWPWQAQLVAFALFSVASIVVWRRLSPEAEPDRPEPPLNQRAEGLIGRVFTLERPIVDGSGTLRIHDTIWRIAGPDCPAGSRVRIAHSDGGLLSVEPE